MLKKIHYLILLLCSMTFLSSCIDLVEEVTVNPDHSGHFSLKLDLGNILGTIGSNIGQYIDASVFNQIKSQPGIIAGQLKKQKGISNVKYVSSENDGLFSVEFDFKSDKELNKAFYGIAGVNKSFLAPSIIKIKKHKVVLMNLTPVLHYAIKKNQSKVMDNSIFKMITFKTICNLPSEVKKVSNNNFTVNKENNSAIFSCSLDDMKNTDINSGNKIKY